MHIKSFRKLKNYTWLKKYIYGELITFYILSVQILNHTYLYQIKNSIFTNFQQKILLIEI